MDVERDPECIETDRPMKLTLRQSVNVYMEGFGNGMVPFDHAYRLAKFAGMNQAECEKQGVHAVLHAFVTAYLEQP